RLYSCWHWNRAFGINRHVPAAAAGDCMRGIAVVPCGETCAPPRRLAIHNGRNSTMKVVDTPSTATTLQYYTQVGPMTDARAYASALRELPHEIAKLCEIIQGLLIHRDLAQL